MTTARRIGGPAELGLAVAALAIALLAVLPAQSAAGAEELSLYDQRIAYRRAVQALRAGRSGEYRREAAKLKDYALRPYLDYYAAQGRLGSMRSKQAKTLREEFSATPIGERFYRQWLNAQVRRGNWDAYLANYEPSDNAAARCNYVRALYRSGEREAALDLVRDLWVSAESMPKTCDPLFEVWIAAGRLDQDTVWARLALAVEANERTLARYLLRFFDKGNAAAGQLYYDAHARPRIVRSLDRFPNTEGGRRALRHGLLRYARDDADRALSLWEEARRSHDFSDADRSYIREQLIATAAEQGAIPDQATPDDLSANAVERIALAMVKHQHWGAAAEWIGALPEDLATTPRWRYWLGSALAETDGAEAGRELLEAAAKQRNYYGFLAAFALDAEPQLNNVPLLGDRDARQELLGVPAVLRMRELFVAGDFVNARREWRFALDSLSLEEQRHLIELTADLGWVEQAIVGARDAELNDILAVRFPTPSLNVYRRYAAEVDLPVHLLLAVSRQESAFQINAQSGAGARGLMQLMPATARLTASRVRLPRPSTSDLADPHTNVRLGAHHFAMLMARYGNRALAAAAYNAGEGRVERWTKDVRAMPVIVWIERIPFRETRDYVKGVLAFQCVYSRLLGDPVPMLETHELVVGR